MKRSARFLSMLCLPVLACGAPRTGPGPKGPGSVREAGSEAPGEAGRSAGGIPAPTADLSQEILLTVAMGSFDEMLSRVTGYLLPHLPPPLQTMFQPAMLKQQLFATLDMPGIDQAVDTNRPLALAMIDPDRSPKGDLGPLLLAIPVQNEGQLVDLLEQKSDRHEQTSHGDHQFFFGAHTMHLRMASGYALVAMGERLLQGAPGVLLPLVRKPVGKEAHLRLEMATIHRLYGPKIDKVLQQLDAKASQGGTKNAGLMRSVAKWMGYIKSIHHLELTVVLDPGDILVRLALAAEPSGQFPDYLKQLTSGPAWGARYLPSDSALIYLYHQSPQMGFESFDEGMTALLEGEFKGLLDPDFLARLREGIKKSFMGQAGQYAVGAWATADGGVGFGGVSRLTDPVAVRRAWLDVFGLIGRELDLVMTKKLPPQLRQKLKGLRIRIRPRPGALRVAGVQGDLVDIAIQWPRLKDRQERERINTIKKGMTKILGRRLALAFAYHDDLSFMALGKDHRQRLAQMVATAKGGAGTGMEQVVQKLAGNKPMISFFYVPAATMAEHVMRVVEQLTPLPPQLRQGIHQILPGPGVTAPITGRLKLHGPRLLWDLSVSPQVLGMMAKTAQLFLAARAQPSSVAPVPAPGPAPGP